MGKVAKPRIVWNGAHHTNFTVGRPGGGRNGQVTKHHIVGSEDSAIAVFKNPSRNGSAHFVVGDRDITQMVNLKDTAWTDGNWQSNLRTITIEHEGGWTRVNGKYAPYTDGMIENAAKLIAWLRDQGYVTHFKLHRDVSTTGTVCPGDLPVERIWNRASQIIAQANKPTPAPQPEWIKNRKVLPKDQSKDFKVYAHKNGIYLYDLDNKLKPVDSRRWGINQDFQIGGQTVVNGKTFYITRSSVNSNAAAGLFADEIKKSPYVPPKPTPVPPPRPETPRWVDSIIDDVNQKMYVIRATPLVDLENGHPFIDPKTNKEVWFQAGDIIKDISAHTIVSEKTYRLTEYAFQETTSGKWKQFGNGIDSNDLSVDPQSTPPGTPANPEVPEVPPQIPGTPTPPAGEDTDRIIDEIKLLRAILDAILEALASLIPGVSKK